MADTCASYVHPVFNPVAPYGYLLPIVYLFMANIANPDLFVYCCRTWICLDITLFYEEQRQPSSGSALPACPKNGKSDSRTRTRNRSKFAALWGDFPALLGTTHVVCPGVHPGCHSNGIRSQIQRQQSCV